MRLADLAFVGTILLAARIRSTEAGKNNDKSNDKGKNVNNNKGVRAPAAKPKNRPAGDVNDLFKSLKNDPSLKPGNRNASNNSKPTNKQTNNSKPNSTPNNKSNDDYTIPVSTMIPTYMPTTYMPTTYMPTTYIPTYIPTYMPTYYWYDDIVYGNTWGNAGDSTSTWWGSSGGKAGKSTSSITWWGSSGGKAGKSEDTLGAGWGIEGKGRKMKEISEAHIQKVSDLNIKNPSGKRKRHLKAGKSDKDGRFRANFYNGGKANKENDNVPGGDDIVLYAYELQTDMPTPVPTTLDMSDSRNSAARTRTFPPVNVPGKSGKEDAKLIVPGEQIARNRFQSTQRPTYIPTYYPTYFAPESEPFVSGHTPIPTYIPTYYPTEYLPKVEKSPEWTMPREWLRGDESERDSNVSGGKSAKRKLKLSNGRGGRRRRQ